MIAKINLDNLGFFLLKLENLENKVYRFPLLYAKFEPFVWGTILSFISKNIRKISINQSNEIEIEFELTVEHAPLFSLIRSLDLDIVNILKLVSAFIVDNSLYEYQKNTVALPFYSKKRNIPQKIEHLLNLETYFCFSKERISLSEFLSLAKNKKINADPFYALSLFVCHLLEGKAELIDFQALLEIIRLLNTIRFTSFSCGEIEIFFYFILSLFKKYYPEGHTFLKLNSEFIKAIEDFDLETRLRFRPIIKYQQFRYPQAYKKIWFSENLYFQFEPFGKPKGKLWNKFVKEFGVEVNEIEGVKTFIIEGEPAIFLIRNASETKINEEHLQKLRTYLQKRRQ